MPFDNGDSTISRRRVLAGSTGVAMAFVAGCQSTSGSPESVEITDALEPQYNFDPLQAGRGGSRRICAQMFDRLYEWDEGLSLIPKIAAGEPEVERDSMRYIIEIVDNAEFHNGDPVTAEDVVYSFTAPVEDETVLLSQYDMIDIDNTEVVDETTVQIDLSREYAPFGVQTLATMVVNKSVREEDPEAYNSNPVGSGPYQYVDHTIGEYVDIEVWDDYWGDVDPNIESVRFTAVPDNSARVSQIQSGDTDVIMRVPASDWDTLDSHEDVEIQSRQGLPYMSLSYNCNEGPTTDADVRRGIEHSFSPDQFVEDVLGETGNRAHAPIPSEILNDWDFPASDYEEMVREYDPERAADLLDGNVPDGWEPRIVCLGRDEYVQFAERVAGRLQALSEYGVEINPQVQALGPGEFDTAAYSGNSDEVAMYYVGFAAHGPDPNTYIQPLLHESYEELRNGIFYDDQEYHDTIIEAVQTTDIEERVELYDSVIRESREQAIHTPIYFQNNSHAQQTYVEDLPVHPIVGNWPRLATSGNNASIQQ
ncbi:ABC transporter substrate-binding protein [Halostagnicola sp. A-GB9-2]|uniref:ABC transporter substrate-binding protein n=1 Tax=Halostagnicola sp. A-GB9-2 TaxID=3048066 RepID=UPI0024C0721E|nr:ABC transporter substrate-binding protein [Halostagnicola sp. A-GB9-2]MDJ1433814.1 ABC transporter substrate-binding protein [Halostagnicola sp. A-GB9-2]